MYDRQGPQFSAARKLMQILSFTQPDEPEQQPPNDFSQPPPNQLGPTATYPHPTIPPSTAATTTMETRSPVSTPSQQPEMQTNFRPHTEPQPQGQGPVIPPTNPSFSLPSFSPGLDDKGFPRRAVMDQRGPPASLQ